MDNAWYSLSASSSIFQNIFNSFAVSMMNADFVWVGIMTDLLCSENEKSLSFTLNFVSLYNSVKAAAGIMNIELMNAT